MLDALCGLLLHYNWLGLQLLFFLKIKNIFVFPKYSPDRYLSQRWICIFYFDIYFGYRLQRACVGPRVVYVTGQSGLHNSERLTLSKCTPLGGGRDGEWGRDLGADLELLMVHRVQYKSSPSGDQFWHLQPRSCKWHQGWELIRLLRPIPFTTITVVIFFNHMKPCCGSFHPFCHDSLFFQVPSSADTSHFLAQHIFQKTLPASIKGGILRLP